MKKNLKLTEDIIKAIDQKETLTSIAQRYGVHRCSIKRLLDRSNIPYTIRSRTPPLWAKNYQLTTEQISVLVGDLFGDGCLVKSGPETAYYQCTHCRDQKPFVEWKYKILYPLSCRTRDFTIRDNRTGSISPVSSMGTWSNKELRVWYQLLYPQGIKTLSPIQVEYLDWRGLAVWYMGDGTRDRKNMRFSIGLGVDLIPIVEALNNKFGPIFGYKKYTYEWNLKILDREQFCVGIKPYLLENFHYKIPIYPKNQATKIHLLQSISVPQ